jgi:CSLREA domain-containing protein
MFSPISHSQTASNRGKGSTLRLAYNAWPALLGLLLTAGVLGSWGSTVPPVYAAAIAVTTTIDELNNDGDCSLREALTAANTNSARDACPAGSGLDTITVPPGTYLLTRAGAGENAAATGDLDITGPVFIIGAGAATTVIDGNDLDRVLHVVGAAPVELTGITLQNGQAPSAANGGGVYLNGGSVVTLTASVVRDNTALGPGLNFGGGVYVASTGKLTLVDSTVSGNNVESLSGTGYTAFGGGIHNSGSLLIMDSLVSANTLTTTIQGEGAGINNFGSMTLLRSTVSENLASAGGSGGGLVNNGNAVLLETEVLSNTGPGFGAGIRAASGSFYLSNSRVEGNAGSYGILVSGGTLSVAGSQIVNNGTGLYAVFGNVTVETSLVAHNSLSGIGSFEGAVQVTDSHLFSNGVGFSSAKGSLILESSTIADSQGEATGNGTGTLRIINSTLSGNLGGGVFQYGTGTTVLTNSTVVSNTFVGLRAEAGTVLMANTLVGGTHNGSTPASDCVGTVTSAGYNLVQDPSGCTLLGDLTGNVVGVSPNVGPLQANDGGTDTHALLIGSLAIDAGSLAACQLRDQRGLFRPADGDGLGGNECDIGAFELSGLVPLRLFVPLIRR